MGASVSTNKQILVNELVNKSINQCPRISTENMVNISGLDFSQPPGCPPGSSFNINQGVSVDANCLLTALQTNSASAATTLDAKAQTGLGISVTNNAVENATIIKNYTKNKCQNASSSNIANLNDVKIQSCNFAITQNATENVACQIKAVQEGIDTVSANLQAQATGGSLFGNLFGYNTKTVIVYAVIILLIIILIIVGYVIYRKMKQQKGGHDNKTNVYGIVILILVLLFLVFLFINCSRTSDKKITEKDADELNKTIIEAQKIAKLVPKSTPTTSTYTSPYASPCPPIVHVRNPIHSSESPKEYSYDYVEEVNLDDFYKPLLS